MQYRNIGKKALQLLIGFVVIILLGSAGREVLEYAGSPWNLMREQPSISSQEYPPLSVPRGIVPFSWELQSGTDLTPTATISANLTGERVYVENCLFCHGTAGRGDGPVAAYLKQPPENLTLEKVQWRKDRDILRSIRRPVGIMPPFSHRLTEAELLSAVEYIRKTFIPESPPRWRASEEEAPEVMGAKLYKYLDCAGCHESDKKIEAAGIPPNLSYAGSKLKKEWIVNYLLDPYPIRWKRENVRPDLRMPGFRLQRHEAEALAEYLAQRVDQERFPIAVLNEPGNLEEGEELFQSYQCQGCHTVAGKGNLIGPDLTHVGSRLKPAYLFHFLKNPEGIIPGTSMKNFDLWDEEARALVLYLESLQ